MGKRVVSQSLLGNFVEYAWRDSKEECVGQVIRLGKKAFLPGRLCKGMNLPGQRVVSLPAVNEYA